MAPTNFLDRRVKARKEEDDSPDELDGQAPLESEHSEAKSESGPEESDTRQKTTSNSGDQSDLDSNPSDSNSEAYSASQPPSPHAALAEISFGALASAQESLGPSRKRKRTSTQDTDDRPPRTTEADERRAGKKAPNPPRTSKHAPTELSSKKAVSRKRSVIPTKTVAARDPRFSALSGHVDQNKLEKNYKFLDDYRASEVADLKARFKKEGNVQAKERLKREIRVMEDKERARKRAEEERNVVREHKKQERERVKDGKKPYFLKKGEVKKQVLVKRFEGMGEKKAEKAMERRRKKKTQKERRGMPMERRGVEAGE
ncbi:MAG: rRNA biogenesis protein rrp36 [Stictis urceolatum]|nr:rRNA biogenesis protein rrp36 [Stictis urceolata]